MHPPEAEGQKPVSGIMQKSIVAKGITQIGITQKGITQIFKRSSIMGKYVAYWPSKQVGDDKVHHSTFSRQFEKFHCIKMKSLSILAIFGTRNYS